MKVHELLARRRKVRAKDALALAAFVGGWLLCTWGLSLYIGRGVLYIGSGALLLGFVGYRVVGAAIWQGALAEQPGENPRG